MPWQTGLGSICDGKLELVDRSVQCQRGVKPLCYTDSLEREKMAVGEFSFPTMTAVAGCQLARRGGKRVQVSWEQERKGERSILASSGSALALGVRAHEYCRWGLWVVGIRNPSLKPVGPVDAIQ